MRDDGVYLEWIEESTDLIHQYLGGVPNHPDETRFREDNLTQDAVLRRLETLADAASHLSAELRSRHPEVEWPRITGFRNILAHAYTEIRLDLVWRTITEDLPALKAVVDQDLR